MTEDSELYQIFDRRGDFLCSCQTREEAELFYRKAIELGHVPVVLGGNENE